MGVSFTRSDGDPAGALGVGGPGVEILDEAGRPCAAARFDAHGRLANPEEAIGEIVNTAGTGFFEGYYSNAEATAARTRGGHFHTGDLGYRDEQGYVYFAGRDVEWLRVEGENFLARPVEDILQRHPDVVLAAVYGVPDAEAGDRVMAALELRPGAAFDPDGFAAFLAAQPDLSSKWAPTYVRVVAALRRSETNKVVKRELQREGFLGVDGADALWWRPRGAGGYRPFVDRRPAGVARALPARREPDASRRLSGPPHERGFEKSGGRFSKNAITASRFSGDPTRSTNAASSRARAARICSLRVARSKRFVCRTASGGCAAIRAAVARTAGSRSSGAHRRLASPSSTARAASIQSAVNSTSAARCQPSVTGSR